MAFRALKLLGFTSFEDTKWILWDKVKESSFRFAITPPPPTPRICFLLDYEGCLIGLENGDDRWFYADVQGSARPLLPSPPTLCYFLMLRQGEPLHLLKPKHASFGQRRLVPKCCQPRLPRFDMEASSGIPQILYMVLLAHEHQEGLFHVVRIVVRIAIPQTLNLQQFVIKIA